MLYIKAFLALTILPICSFASETEKANSNKLFSSSETLELILHMDMKEVLEDKSDEPKYSPAVLIQKIDEKTIHTFNIKIKARGNTRRLGDICEFPPIKINFKKNSTEKTVFEGQDKIKMVTHCNESENYQNYALLEYLVYKTFNTLTDYSYRVRLVHVVYRDIKRNYPDLERSGFLIEDDDLLAKRLNGNISDKKIWSPDSCESKAVDVFAIFQFMIGNTDWWIHTRHNVDLVSLEDNSLIPIPFDFDGAGIINTPYAMPSTQLPIISVKDRFFKGSCRTTLDYRETIELFNQNRSSIISLFENANYLERKYRISSLKYIKRFYSIVNDQDQFSKYLSKTCEYLRKPVASLN